jgi:hypothetical protein
MPRKRKSKHTDPHIFWRNGRACADLRAYAAWAGTGGAVRARFEVGTKDEVIAEALFAARVTALQERRRGRVGAEGGKRHTTYIMARAGVPLEGD